MKSIRLITGSVIYLMLVLCASSGQALADNNFLIGPECGPMHIVSDSPDWGLIEADHLTFRQNAYFYSTLERGGFDYDREKVGQKRFFDANGNEPPGRYVEILTQYHLKTLVYPHAVDVVDQQQQLIESNFSRFHRCQADGVGQVKLDFEADMFG